MSAYPNKPTMIAAALYGISAQVILKNRKGESPVAWCDLTAEQNRPFIDAAQYLLGQTFGVAPQVVDRARLAAGLEAQKFPGVDGNANTIVSVFVNIASLLPG